MASWGIFALFSIVITALSLKSLRHPSSHGFTRYFAWEGMLWLLISNAPYWFVEPFSLRQIISWLLLFGSIYPAVAGYLLLRKEGDANRQKRSEVHLYDFEKTTRIISTGIYRYIRHPLYLSLIMLTWGIRLKHVTITLTIIAAACSLLLYLTARRDEKECLQHFGDTYADYMRKSKMFVPFLF